MMSKDYTINGKVRDFGEIRGDLQAKEDKQRERIQQRMLELRAAAGAVVLNTAFGAYDEITLEGALLWAEQQNADGALTQTWQALGEKARLARAPHEAPDAEPLIYEPASLDKDLRAEVRALRLSPASGVGIYTGTTSLSLLIAFARVHGGTVHRPLQGVKSEVVYEAGFVEPEAADEPKVVSGDIKPKVASGDVEPTTPAGDAKPKPASGDVKSKPAGGDVKPEEQPAEVASESAQAGGQGATEAKEDAVKPEAKPETKPETKPAAAAPSVKPMTPPKLAPNIRRPNLNKQRGAA